MVALGTFVLHSFVRPPVTAGSYELHGTQPMDGITVGEHVADVVVSSPRYTMPPDQILSTFPPAMAEGDFGSRLPQIVLKRRTLPWERDPGGPPRGAKDPPRPWLALVVLAEGEGSLSPDPAPVAQCVTPGLVLPHPEDADGPTGYYLTVTDTVVQKVFPTVEDLPLLVHVREVDLADTELANGDDDGWMAVVLANRLPIAVPADPGPTAGRANPTTGQPVSAPVKYLACLINLEGQVGVLPTDASLDTDDTFHLVAAVQDLRTLATAAASTDLVVMGTGQVAVTTAVLGAAGPEAAEAAGAEAAAAVAGGVSFGANAHLANAAASVSSNAATTTWGNPASSTSTAAKVGLGNDAGVAIRKEMAGGFAVDVSWFVLEKTYRFPVLAHWTFTGTNDGDFRSIVQSLDVGMLGTEYGTVYGIDPNGSPTTEVEHVNLPDPKAPPRPAPPELAATGHIALPQTTRRGEPATAWYRGPFGPLATDRDPPDGPMAHVSDRLRTLTPDGREDVSLAAAFEIGRLLGLSQPSVVSALVQWRQEQFGAARAEQLANVAAGGTPLAATTPTFRGDLGRLVGMQLMTVAGQQPTKVAGPNRPVADPGRPLQLQGSLDQVVAKGLGLDLEQLLNAAQQQGMVSALASTQVVLAGDDNPTGPAQLQGLRDRLNAELRVVASSALSKSVGPLQLADDEPPAVTPAVAREAAVGGTAGEAARKATGGGPEPRDALDDLLDRLSGAAGEGGVV